MKDIAIFGVGGFGREILALIKEINKVDPIYHIVGFFDDGHEKGEMVNGIPVLGKIDELNCWPTEIGVVVAIGDSEIRKHVVSRINNPKVFFPSLIHPNVVIEDAEFVKTGIACIICAGNIFTTNIVIGDFVIFNLGCTIGHDVSIGDYVCFMPSCNVSGEVTIAEGAYCGTGVKIINQISIGKNATVGAGAVVTMNIPDDCVAVGVPARIIKKKNLS